MIHTTLPHDQVCRLKEWTPHRKAQQSYHCSENNELSHLPRYRAIQTIKVDLISLGPSKKGRPGMKDIRIDYLANGSEMMRHFVMTHINCGSAPEMR